MHCDANIRVRRRTTSCALAQNVFYEYWNAPDRGLEAEVEVEAYSPVTDRTYALTCREGPSVICTGPSRLGVRFPLAAVDSYDAEQAAAYCAGHAVGPGGVGVGCDEAADEAAAAVDGDANQAAGDECDPNYEGACLDPNASDYDCEGGSGDGPEYTGTVTVVGDDPFGLDRDGDGIGCDP